MVVGSSLWYTTDLLIAPPHGKTVAAGLGLPSWTMFAVFLSCFHSCSGSKLNTGMWKSAWALFFGSWLGQQTTSHWFMLVMEEVPARQQGSPQNQLKTDLWGSPSPLVACPLQSTLGDFFTSLKRLESRPPSYHQAGRKHIGVEGRRAHRDQPDNDCWWWRSWRG